MNPETEMPIHDIDTDIDAHRGFSEPDWSLISPQGLMAVLQMSVTVFTKVSTMFFWNYPIKIGIFRA